MLTNQLGRELALIDEATSFPLGRFLSSSGSLNHRKIRLLKPWRQQEALNAYFILKAIRFHGAGFYGYREVQYKRADLPVRIWCPDHEDFFWQRAQTHMQGHGCPECARKIIERHTPFGNYVVPCHFHQYTILDDGRTIQFFNRFKTLNMEIPNVVDVNSSEITDRSGICYSTHLLLNRDYSGCSKEVPVPI